MICNLSSDLSTKATVWVVRDIASGSFIQGVPAHKVQVAMRQLELKRQAA